jgi:hypothetical protein
MRKAIKKRINKKPLLALAIILFGIGIALYVCSSKEGFVPADNRRYPKLGKIYGLLNTWKDMLNNVNATYTTNEGTFTMTAEQKNQEINYSYTRIKELCNQIIALKNADPPNKASQKVYEFLLNDANFMKIYNSTTSSQIDTTVLSSVIKNIYDNFPSPSLNSLPANSTNAQIADFQAANNTQAAIDSGASVYDYANNLVKVGRNRMTDISFNSLPYDLSGNFANYSYSS